jgi:hypothetical protein
VMSSAVRKKSIRELFGLPPPHDLNAPPKHLMVRMMPPCHIRGSFLRQMRHGASANNTAPITFPLVFMRWGGIHFALVVSNGP